jgi:transcriptional regulator of acetoin/glycerol metabolism
MCVRMPDNPERFRDPEEIIRAIAENRRVREEARLELEGEREVMAALLIRGRAAGLSVSAMARAAGISRETAHKILREAGVTSKKKARRSSRG